MKRLLFPLLIAVASVLAGCEGSPAQYTDWVRGGEPVLRDPIAQANYEVASDAHVFFDQSGQPRLIYTGDDSGVPAIKLAKRSAPDQWVPDQILIGPSTGRVHPKNKETPFYLYSNGKHQIYFIGYEDETTYESSVYLAVSDALEGPYRVLAEPVLPRGRLADRFVHTITSPSVMIHDGRLHMVFLGWDDFQNVTEVWSIGVTSDDNGRTWSNASPVQVPIGMEGQVSPTPNGKYVAVRTGEYRRAEAIFLADADHPFGPYTEAPDPILTQAGRPWEVNEITAPQITFDPDTGAPILYFTGADHSKGWWILTAQPGGTD